MRPLASSSEVVENSSKTIITTGGRAPLRAAAGVVAFPLTGHAAATGLKTAIASSRASRLDGSVIRAPCATLAPYGG